MEMSEEGRGTIESKPIAKVIDYLTERYPFLRSKFLQYTGGILLLAVAGYLAYYFVILKPEEETARKYLWLPEKFFMMDSLEKALYGPSPDVYGFLQIATRYPSTDAGKLASLYAGLIYMKMEKYDSAIEFLRNASPGDVILRGMVPGLIGTAYLELNDTLAAEKYFAIAATCGEKTYVEPLFLFRLARLKEHNGKYREALEYYQKIKREYPGSDQARDIDKYIARVLPKVNTSP